jgi:hypothetical protein
MESISNGNFTQQCILHEADFIQAQIANGGVITTELPELNTQFINQIEQQYEEYGISAIIAMNPAIEVMARQCPYQGGTAVYRARYFVSLVNDSIDYDDENVCLTAGIWRKAGENNTVKTDFLIVPNPTTKNINIRFNNSLNTPINLTILTMDGKTVYSQQPVLNGLTISINDLKLESGVYQIAISFSDATILSKKLVIIK